MLFQVGGIYLISRLIDGQFPNYRQLIPETFDYEVAVDHDELLEAVRRVGLLAQKNAPLRLRFADNTLTVSAESQDVGKAHEAMPVQYSGDDLEIGFNPEFLEAGVAAVKEDAGLPALHQPAAPGAGQGRGGRLPLPGHAHPPERLGRRRGAACKRPPQAGGSRDRRRCGCPSPWASSSRWPSLASSGGEAKTAHRRRGRCG